MKRTTITTVLASAATVVAGLGLAAPASASTTAGGYNGWTTTTSNVAVGKAEGFAGNRHQVVLQTVNGYVAKDSYIRSYYCPSGATISPTWASSKCTWRSTYLLSNFEQNGESGLIGRVSSTGASATQTNLVTAKSRNSSKRAQVVVNLKIYRMAEGGQPFWVKGTVAGAPLQAGTRDGRFGRL